ncbi:RagB/SusD family nutrient uptake outer membrane protein [Pedobacter yonginense]|uniref:RagB/SusD family nutrient uptake outer membrane protein n=1 Tax=Pedobacter yonginense TaxID=651869 RepID=A0A317ERX7_9SPHI|nr:RagB/SusD family nutrient uptake outer membrane protein [Pedobacter yonginense]PWS28619.1 RagB/SusD family nutrient uptake outer membrane protein [Pedobacter yonginense]
MKNLYQYTIKFMLVALLVTVLGSCKKSFLEILPKGRIIASKTTDYDLMLNNLDLINSSHDGQLYLGDEVAALEPNWTGASFREKQLFKYEGDLYTADEDAKETLVPLKALYIYNKIINEVPESTGGTDISKKNVEAEARVGRAWTYFLLINYFGKPYNAATAATDPGFPLITEADVTRKDFERVSVQEIYNLILNDLNTAIPNLINTGVVWRGRVCKATAKGLLAKVYMTMGRYTEALPLLDESISGVTGPGAAVTVSLYNYNTAFPGFPTAVNDFESLYTKNTTNLLVVTSNRTFWLTAEASALFDPADLRLVASNYTSTTLPNGVKLLKRIGTSVSNLGVRLSDLYLMRAEVKARLNDLTGAVNDVVFLRQNRLPAGKQAVPAGIAGAKMPLIQFILEERIREFALQGHRWYDMRRLSVDPLFTTPTYQHKVYNTTGVVSETFTLKPERFVFRFSPKVLGENPGLVNNP